MLDKEQYVDRTVGWLVKFSGDKELIEEVMRTPSLDGLYSGKSKKIRKLLRIAYLRGVRRGAICAWQGQQPIVPRANLLDPCTCGHTAEQHSGHTVFKASSVIPTHCSQGCGCLGFRLPDHQGDIDA